jgi:hypothetical protein
LYTLNILGEALSTIKSQGEEEGDDFGEYDSEDFGEFFAGAGGGFSSFQEFVEFMFLVRATILMIYSESLWVKGSPIDRIKSMGRDNEITKNRGRDNEHTNNRDNLDNEHTNNRNERCSERT